MRDKIALVTGAASGIGAEVSRQLAAAGARVVLLDVDAPKGGAVAREIGGHLVVCDVADRRAWFDAVAECIEAVGVPDFVHLNAGVMSVAADQPPAALEDLPEENYRRIVGVNLDGVVFGLQALLPHMRGREGAICITASLVGLIPLAMDPMYCATKHALVGLARSVAGAVAVGPLRVNAICPGVVDTPIIPTVLRGGDVSPMPPEVLAAEVVDLLEQGANGEVRVRLAAGLPSVSVPVPAFGDRQP